MGCIPTVIRASPRWRFRPTRFIHPSISNNEILKGGREYVFLPPSIALYTGRSAEVAHLVERDLAKVEVAGSSPVFRSEIYPVCAASETGFFFDTRVVELVDTQDLKSCSQ